MNQKENRSSRWARLSPAKQVLLTKRLATPQALARIHRRPNQETYPLSFAQERLWFLAQLAPNNPTYNRPLMLRLSGVLDVSALAFALSKIIERHEVLRATFLTVAGQPMQQIKPAELLDLPVIDLSDSPAGEQEQKTNRLLTREVEQPFDLSESLFRATLLRLAQEEHILLLVIHHIAFDAWSAQLVIKEMVALYDAASQGQPSPLPEPPIQVADFAHWQRQHLQGERLGKQLSYWKKQLVGIEPLNLPTDHARSDRQTSRAGQHALILPSTLVEALRTVSQQEGATFFMILLAAFQCLLYRYTAQDDIAVGTPIAERTHVETEGLIGCFLNTLVLRSDLSGNPTFRQLLAKVRQVTLEAYAHQELPFEKLVEELQPTRELNRSPLFQVMFNLENLRPPSHQPTSERAISINEFELDTIAAQFDLTLEIVATDRELTCLFVYDSDLFEAATIKRMAGHFQTLLAGIVANPETPISNLPLLTAAERHQLLVEWNNTAAEYPREQCIHQLFEEQVERTPEAVALIFDEEQLTYRQLNARANQLAHHLIQLGVGPEVLVGIYVERSLEMIIGILAILKAGGAYVPIDPRLPQERISFMLQDAQIKVLLTEQRWLSALALLKPLVVCLDLPPTAITDQNQENPVSLGQPSNLAYVIYTSGSSGLPKGAMITHQNLSNHFHWRHRSGMICAEDRILQHTTISFDVAAVEIFPPLLSGARVVIAQPGTFQDIDHMIKTISKEQITMLDLPPSLLPLFLAALQFSYCTSLRQVRSGGEAITVELKL